MDRLKKLGSKRQNKLPKNASELEKHALCFFLDENAQSVASFKIRLIDNNFAPSDPNRNREGLLCIARKDVDGSVSVKFWNLEKAKAARGEEIDLTEFKFQNEVGLPMKIFCCNAEANTRIYELVFTDDNETEAFLKEWARQLTAKNKNVASSLPKNGIGAPEGFQHLNGIKKESDGQLVKRELPGHELPPMVKDMLEKFNMDSSKVNKKDVLAIINANGGEDQVKKEMALLSPKEQWQKVVDDLQTTMVHRQQDFPILWRLSQLPQSSRPNVGIPGKKDD